VTQAGSRKAAADVGGAVLHHAQHGLEHAANGRDLATVSVQGLIENL